MGTPKMLNGRKKYNQEDHLNVIFRIIDEGENQDPLKPFYAMAKRRIETYRDIATFEL